MVHVFNRTTTSHTCTHTLHTWWMYTLATGYFPLPLNIPTVRMATLQQRSQERLFRSDKRAERAACSGPCGNTRFSFQRPHTVWSLPQMLVSLDNCSTQDKCRNCVLTGILLKVKSNFIFVPFVK